MQWSNACCPVVTIAASLMLNSALASGLPSLQGQFKDGIYTSPSGSYRCDISEFATSPGFFLNESHDPGVSETMSFAVERGSHLEIWIVRTQQEGRLDYLPGSEEGFPVTRETFIPYYYSELPYSITSVKQWKEPHSQSEVLRVQMDDEAQLHAYWLEQSNGWLNSIQLMPTLVGTEAPKLEVLQIKESLFSVRERCTFK